MVSEYLYNAIGDLREAKDPGRGNKITHTMDTRGRVTQSNDPSLGIWNYQYTVLDQLKQQTDAKSQVTTLTYDKLSRVTQVVAPGLVSTFTYDTATKGRGQLAQMETTPGNNRRTHTYDTYGDVAFGVNAVIDGVSEDFDRGGMSEVLIRATGGRSNQGFFEQVNGNYCDTSIVLGPIANLDKKAIGVGFGAAITRRYGGYSFGQLIRNGPALHLGTYGASARLATATTVVNSTVITVSYEGGNYAGSLLRTTINRTARSYQERFGD